MDENVEFVQKEMAKHFVMRPKSIPDRHYEDMSTKKLIDKHSMLYDSFIKIHTKKGFAINMVAQDKLNLLLEYERELALRENNV